MEANDRIKGMIFEEMKRRKISKEKFAEMMGCHWMTVCKWQRGGGMTLEVAERALKTLGLSAEIGDIERKAPKWFG